MSPAKAMIDLAWLAWEARLLQSCSPGCRNLEHRHMRPGIVIEALPGKQRSLLRQLKSSDISNAWCPPLL